MIRFRECFYLANHGLSWRGFFLCVRWLVWASTPPGLIGAAGRTPHSRPLSLWCVISALMSLWLQSLSLSLPCALTPAFVRSLPLFLHLSFIIWLNGMQSLTQPLYTHTHINTYTHACTHAHSRFLSLTLCMGLLSLSLSGSLSCARALVFLHSVALSLSRSRSLDLSLSYSFSFSRSLDLDLSLVLYLELSLSTAVPRAFSLSPSLWAFSRSPCPALSLSLMFARACVSALFR